MTFAFVLPNSYKVSPTAESIGTSAEGGKQGGERLEKYGIRESHALLTDPYKWESSMGGWSPSCRSSVVRVVTFKMFGTAIGCAIMANHPQVGRWTGHSCAMCAAVNFVAGFHYILIWMVRAQVLPESYNLWKVKVGHRYVPLKTNENGANDANKKKIDEQTLRDNQVIFAQETIVDGLRSTDWACTLVLMTMELAHFRQWIFLAGGRGDETKEGCYVGVDTAISTPWLCVLQGVMVGFGTSYRFYFNECRSKEGKLCSASNILGLCCLAISCGTFAVIMSNLGFGVPGFLNPGCYPGTASKDLDLDVTFYYIFVWIWVGYPIVTLVSRFALRNTPHDEYNATVSMAKDLTYGTLDGIAKAGMAFYFLAKSAQYSPHEEYNAICGPESANNLSYYCTSTVDSSLLFG